MMNYHYSTRTNKFEVCKAQDENCRYSNETHISSETFTKVMEATNQPQVSNEFEQNSSKSIILDTALLPPNKIIPMQRGNYVGVHYGRFDREVINQATDYLRDKFNANGNWDSMRLMILNKHKRDGNEYHTTVFSPKETRQLRKNGHNIHEIAEKAPVASSVFLGVGKASGSVRDGRVSTAYYAIVANDSFQEYRQHFGLSPADFHITLAFDEPGDVHNVAKDFSTRIA